jgi:YesN/AraC family two-component response regulator
MIFVVPTPSEIIVEIRKVTFFKPQIVILDIDMPRLNGLETIAPFTNWDLTAR